MSGDAKILRAYSLALSVDKLLRGAREGLTASECDLVRDVAINQILEALESLPVIEEGGAWVRGAETRMVSQLLRSLSDGSEVAR